MTNKRSLVVTKMATVLVTFVLLLSCSGPQHKELAETGVAQFRSDFKAERYHSIYVSADDEFRKSMSEADFVAAMQLVHRKLGNARQTQLRYYVDGRMANETGAILTITYDTDFDGGKGTEQFAWRVGKRANLLKYNVNADALAH